MFKILGLILISISIVIIINKNIILRYFTYIFISEAIAILENMKTGCIMGKTYSKVFSELDYSGFKFFIYGTEYIHRNLLLIQRVNTTEKIFSQCGKRIKSDETEFLDSNIIILNNMADKYRHYVETNRKTQVVSSVSLILILTIVVV